MWRFDAGTGGQPRRPGRGLPQGTTHEPDGRRVRACPGLLRLVCLVAVMAVALCELRSGSVARWIGQVLNHDPSSVVSTETGRRAAFLVDPPSYTQSLSSTDHATTRIRTAMLLAERGRRVRWVPPAHLEAAPHAPRVSIDPPAPPSAIGRLASRRPNRSAPPCSDAIEES